MVKDFLITLWGVVCEMAPYLLLGFLVAGVLHVFVPSRFYRNYLNGKGFRPVFIAALLGVPLPLCSCGVIPTAVGLRREGASRGAVAAFLIATPQTGIDSILATFSLMGLGFAIVRPAAALVTGICGGLLVNRLLRREPETTGAAVADYVDDTSGNRLVRVFRYSFVSMIQDIGPRLLLGLLIAALIQMAVPDEFFLRFGSNTLLQMLVMLVIAVPMYVCSTGSIPIAAALLAKGLSPGAALVLLMAGPAVNLGSILVIHKTMGRRFMLIYLLTIIVGAVTFGLILNNADGLLQFTSAHTGNCCADTAMHTGHHSLFRTVCGILILLFILNAFAMKIFERFRKEPVAPSCQVYRVEGMHCNHCKASVEKAVSHLKGVDSASVNLEQKTLTVQGTATDKSIADAVNGCGFEFKGLV